MEAKVIKEKIAPREKPTLNIPQYKSIILSPFWTANLPPFGEKIAFTQDKAVYGRLEFKEVFPVLIKPDY